MDTRIFVDILVGEGKHGRIRNKGVDQVTYSYFRRLAGNGTVDQRCKNILTIMSPKWWGTEPTIVIINDLPEILQIGA